MKIFPVCILAPLINLVIFTASAHPGSGIVVDEQGNVYFNYFGRGLGKIDPQRNLTFVGNAGGGHWLCLDTAGSFSRAQPVHFQRITPDGVKPALIYADGGSPIAVLPDGNLYYASGDETMEPGGLQVARQSPRGQLSIFPPGGKETTEKLMGITGLAAGPDGLLYIASPSAVTRLKMDGTFTIIVNRIQLKDCDVDYPDHNPQSPNSLPFLRGLAVDDDGSIFSAAVSCHCVVKISPNGKVQSILKAERPWSPTGVAVHHHDVYVLEYTNANGPSAEGWTPRIRKIDPHGKITTVFTGERK